MKKKIVSCQQQYCFFSRELLEIGWRFFNMVVCCKEGGRKKERKNGLNYPIYG